MGAETAFPEVKMRGKYVFSCFALLTHTGGCDVKKWFFLLALFMVAVPVAANEGLYLGAGLMVDHYPGPGPLYMAPGGNLKLGYDFGVFSIEGNVMEDSHDDKYYHLGAKSRGFQGVSRLSAMFVDVRIPVWEQSDRRKAYYAVVGAGKCVLSGHDYVTSEDAKYTGIGYNVGVGSERYISQHVAFNLAAIYRTVRFDKKESQGSTTTLSPKLSDDLLSIEIGFNYHF
jgi:hypothetical protein